MVTLHADTLIARLRDLGIATPQQIELAKQELASTQERFSTILARHGVLRDVDVGKRLALQLGSLPQALELPLGDAPAARQVPAAMWRSHRLIPLRESEGTLLLATDDPFSVFALDFFRGRCGCTLEAILIKEQELTAMLETLSKSAVPAPEVVGAAARPVPPPAPAPRPTPPPQQAPGFHGHSPQSVATAASVPAVQRGEAPLQRASPTSASTDEPIIQLVDSMLAEAVRMRASDIHLESGMHQLGVRYRVDGVLHDVNSPPKALHGSIVSRLKIMAGLNIAEKRLPQDGRLQLTVAGRPLDVRVSILPATHGESIVMRLLDRSQPIRGLAEMGLPVASQQAWEELIHRPHGMVLVTGPTGSGKTTTLYGALAMLNQADRKIITVEDPVEYQLSGVNQVLVKSSIGLTFAAGLRAMLRQAPDVIMVGEIRDQETAQIAVQAALTGHLVLSTLHTNDASSAMTRLIDMGIAPFLIASTVQGVLAQRLVRRVCWDCRMTDNATVEERAFLGPPEVAQVIRSNGCEKCHGSGFFGRIGLFELLVISDAIREIIVTKPTASAIRAIALTEGMRSLRDDGCAKIREGLTTMAEVLRVVADVEI